MGNVEVPVTTTPRKKKKGKKGSNLGSSSGTKKKKKRKRASPKKSNNPNLEESNEEVMTKLMAVKQLKQQPMLIATPFSKEGCSQKTLSRWDVSAQTLLNMTLTFLRHVPERVVVNHPKNRGIISRLLDLTSPEALTSFQSRTIHWSSLM